MCTNRQFTIHLSLRMTLTASKLIKVSSRALAGQARPRTPTSSSTFAQFRDQPPTNQYGGIRVKDGVSHGMHWKYSALRHCF